MRLEGTRTYSIVALSFLAAYSRRISASGTTTDALTSSPYFAISMSSRTSFSNCSGTSRLARSICSYFSRPMNWLFSWKYGSVTIFCASSSSETERFMRRADSRRSIRSIMESRTLRGRSRARSSSGEKLPWYIWRYRSTWARYWRSNSTAVIRSLPTFATT